MKKIIISWIVLAAVNGMLATRGDAQRSKEYMTEAVSRCEDFKRQVKNDIYIPQAMLNEKENCIIREFATVVKEDHQDVLDTYVASDIEACVKESITKERTFKIEIFQGCIAKRVEELVKRINGACEDVPKFLKVGMGKQGCEEALILLVAEEYKKLINPDPPKWLQAYMALKQILKPVLPWAFYVSLLVILIYFADLFWHEKYRWIQMAVVTMLYSAMLVLNVFKDFYPGPMINIVLIGIIILWNHRPPKKEKDLGVDLETALKYYDRDHKPDKEPHSEDAV